MRETTNARRPSQKQIEKQEAIDHLRKVLKPGDRVYGIVRSVSRSGMSRTIDFYAFQPHECECKATGVGANHDPGCRGDVIDRVYLSGWIATALDYNRTDQGALRVSGAGMDMVFGTVYHLSRVLFPQGFGIACDKCGKRPVSPEQAAEWRKVFSPARLTTGLGMHRCEFYGRNGDRSGWDTDGGYALKAESL
jgi:hypothetical protein